MKKLFLKTICLALFAAIFLTVASSCKKGSGDKGNVDEQKTLKIGVLREDDSSDEASAWEKYLKTVGKALNMTVDFTTTNSSSSEVSAINTYASKGYNAILLFSDDDFVASVSAAANKKMYVVSPTGHPTEEQYEQVAAAIPGEVEKNYQLYLESLEKPMPFYIGVPVIENNKLKLVWDVSYDFDAEDITYTVEVARDYLFQDVIYRSENQPLPEMAMDVPEAGQYFVRVRAGNKSGYTQDAFDYYVTDSGKNYGMKCFYVTEDNRVEEDTYDEK